MYVQSNTLLLAYVFEHFQSVCFEIYELYPARFLIAPGLPWHGAYKNTKEKLDLLADINMLLMVEIVIKAGICHAIYQNAKANNKYMKDYDKNKEWSYLMYWDIFNLQGWEMSQKLPIDDFKGVKNRSQFSKEFRENYNQNSGEGCFLEVDVWYLEDLYELHNNLQFLPETLQMGIVGKVLVNLYGKNEYVTHIRNLKQVLNSIKKLEKKNQNFEKHFLQLMKKAVIRKTWKMWENIKV